MVGLLNWKFRSLNEFDSAEGTVTLVDETHQAKTERDIVLVPQPSDDINDPLNWPTIKKIGAFMPIIIFSFVGNWSIAGLAVAVPQLMSEFGRGLNDTAQGFVGYPILGLGLGVSSLSFHLISEFPMDSTCSLDRKTSYIFDFDDPFLCISDLVGKRRRVP